MARQRSTMAQLASKSTFLSESGLRDPTADSLTREVEVVGA